MSLGPLDSLPIDAPLTKLAIKYTNPKYIARDLLTPVPVDKESSYYYVRDKRNELNAPANDDNEIGMTGTVPKRRGAATSATYACKTYGEAEDVILSGVANMQGTAVDPRGDATARASGRVWLKHEIRTAALLRTAANYAGNSATLSGTSQWSDPASNPVLAVRAARRAIWRSPESRLVFWMGREVFDVVAEHAVMLDRIKYGGSSADPSRVTAGALAQLFEVDAVLIGDAQRDAANPGQNASYSYVWGKDAGIAAVEPRPSQESLHLASNFEWLKPYVTTEFFKNVGQRGIEEITVRHSNDLRIVAPDAGFLWKNAVA